VTTVQAFSQDKGKTGEAERGIIRLIRPGTTRRPASADRTACRQFQAIFHVITVHNETSQQTVIIYIDRFGYLNPIWRDLEAT